MDQSREIAPGVVADDVERMTLNREFAENGIDGVSLVESQVEE